MNHRTFLKYGLIDIVNFRYIISSYDCKAVPWTLWGRTYSGPALPLAVDPVSAIGQRQLITYLLTPILLHLKSSYIHNVLEWWIKPV